MAVEVVAPEVVIAVQDCAPVLPGPARHGLDAEHGRGLALVDALDRRWGVRPEGPGKAVWFALPLVPRPR